MSRATPEGKVKDQVKKLLKHYGAYQFWPVQTGFGAPALDCHGHVKGVAFAVETKAPGKTLTPRQQLTKAEFEAAGGVVFVVGEKLISETGMKRLYASQKQGVYSGMAELHEWLNAR